MNTVKRLAGSLRVSFLIIALAIVGIASVTFDSFPIQAFFAGSSGQAVQEPVVAPADGFVPGTCDTAGPIEVESSGGTTTPTAYPTLKAAFDAINAGTHTGTITIDVCGNTDETTLTAALNGSGTGSASYSSILIAPAGGAARTISGATTAGSPLIDFNGADNVTVDGLNTGGNSLTISNTTVSATSGTSTIRFQADATGNTITNSSILGSSTMSTTTNGGNIWFGAGAVTTGNDNNIISNNNIGPAGANLPTKLIYGNGSTTNTTVYNSGIQITGNNLFDYFNAAAQANAVYLAGGNTGWTINNNRVFQTATRTQTTGAILAGIQAASATGNDGHTISGNIIGFANSAGTGTTNFVGVSTSSKFIGIYISSAATTTPSSIQGNTIAGINLSGIVGGTSTTASFLGISIGSGVSNIGNVSGNTVGSLSAPGSISITNNNASGSEIYGIYYFPSAVANVSNNNVGGIVSNNSGAGSVVFYGIRAFTSSSVTNTMSNNTIGSAAAPITNTSSSASSRTIGLYCQSGACLVTGNTIGSLSMNGPNVGTGSSASMIGLWIDNSSATIGNSVAQNTVRAISNTDAAAAVWVTGMQYNGATTGTHTVQRNFIHSITSASSSPTATVNGINVQGGLTTFRNNMIAIGGSMTAQSPQINGINETVAGTDNFYHNSVYIGGTGVAAGSGNSFAFQSAITTNTRNYRNNIFFNARSNGAATGKHYAIRVGGAAPLPSGLTSNNNLLFANGSGGFIGQFNLIDQATLANWQAATGNDSNSFSADPQFVDATNAIPDLHLHPTNPTVAEGNGFDVGVTDDFDGQTRSGLTPVDIGADAGNFSGIDLAGPAISYTAFGNTSSTGDRVLVTTITDNSGVPTTGVGLPVIYYRKNAGAWASTQCSLISGNNYDCSIVAAAVGGVVATDIIQYYVAAQDNVGNVAVNPSAGAGGLTPNPPAASTPPTPNQYTIVPAISGSLNVGTGETYLSLTNAGGVFEAINNAEVTGNITVNITSDLTAETGTVALNEFASPYTLLIKPSGAPRTISGTNAGAMIRLNGADRVRFDGSTAASFEDNVAGGNPALRELTIQNTNTGTAAGVINVGTGTNGAQNNTFKNLNILGQDPTTTLLGIAIGGNTPGTTGADNDGNRVENCSVKRAIFGIYAAGISAANQNTGTVITLNDLSATGADRVRRVGILVFNDDGAQITENSIATETNESADAIGIGVGTQGVDTTTTTGGGVTNALVARNKINGIASLSTTGFSAAGITVAGGTTGANTIVNNMITGVTAPSTSPDIVAGIFVAGVTGSTTRLYSNSVSLTGDRGSVASQIGSFGLAVTGTDPTLDLKNNIFYTTQTSGGGTNAKSYAIGMVTTTFVNLDSNYNDFWSTGANDGGFRTGSLAGGAGTDYADITAWRTAVSDDLNSLESDPSFVNPASDLHIQTSSTMSDAGVTVAAVTNDFDSEPRFAPPEIGADELPDTIPPDTTILTNPTNPSTSSSASFTFNGSDTGGSGVASFECKLDAGSFAACTSPQNYTSLSQGSHTFEVRAKDGAGNVDATPASYTWTVDAIAPDTQILTNPTNPTTSTSASFTFSGTDSFGGPSVTFECKLDAGSFAACTSPQNYTGLALGSHTFEVRAKDAVGNVDPTPASYTWTINPASVGPVTVTATAGNTGPVDYATLKLAFDAINAGTHQGAITVAILQNTTETASAVLNESGSGSASYTSVSIQPSGGAARSVSGAVIGHLVDLNGADNVTIDGLNTGGNSLTFANTALGASSTIRFTNDASNNTVTNVTLQGSGDTSFGVVYFGGGTATGNDNNTVSNSAITAAGSNLPLNGIYSFGTSAAIDNSGNIITGNSVSDFFNAGSASSGMNINSNNSGWTISNNKIFQTGTRTYTTGSTHNGINITSGSGYTIGGNTIGYAAANGTGVYTMAGTVATRFVGINLAVGNTSATNVDNNTVAAISLATSSGAATTSGVLCGINIASGDVNVGVGTGNTIGSTTGTDSLVATPTTTQGAVVGIHSASTGNIQITGNNIGGFTSAGATAAVAGAVFGINVSGAATSLTVSNNTIGNATANNMRSGVLGTTTGSSLASGINQTAPPVTATYSNNTIRNLSSYGTGTGGYVRGIQTGTTAATGASSTISGNTITNLTTSGAVSGSTSGNTSALGIHMFASANATVTNNTITNISNINTGTVGTVVAGISFASTSSVTSTGATISGNRVYGLANASTTTSATLPGVAVGVTVRSGNGTVSVFNNMIGIGAGQTSATSFIGLWSNHGSTPDPTLVRWVYNTVNIEGAAASGANSTFGFFRGDFSTTARTAAVEVKNNILINNRTGGTGRHFAIANNFGATTTSATGWGAGASNNNVLTSSNPATVGFWTADQTFAGWKLASSSDLLSYSGIPVTFVGATDLHLNMGVTPTSLESGGVAISGITTDIDGQVRPGPAGSTNGGAFAPDIGADEFDGVYLDAAAPLITYSTFGNTSSTANRVLAITVTDSTGVAGGGNSPRVYFRKSTDANYVSTACVSTGGTPQNGTYNCTIDYSLVGGGSVTAGDIIQYFVVAQDTVGNVAANPSSGFAATSVNNVTSPPSNPNSYPISVAYSGSYNIGPGNPIASITNPGGLFEALNNGVLTGNATFNITADMTAETGTVTLNQIIEEGVGGYTVTIKPSGGARTISGSNATALLRMNDVDRLTIDGSTTLGTATQVGGDAALRELTIQNTSTTATAGTVIAFGSSTNGAQNNKVRNVNVLGQDPTQTLIGIHMGGAAPGSAGTDNDGNRIENCSFKRSFIGIYNTGASAANPNTGNVITMNDLSATGADRMRRAGIFFFNQDGIQVTMNSIGGITADESADAIGIIAGIQNVTTTAVTSGGVSNSLIARNRINGVASTSTTGFSAAGIAIAGDPAGANTVANNMITGVNAPSTSPDITAGIFVAGVPSSNTKLYYNSVSMTGDRGTVASQIGSYGLAITGTDPTVELKNNVFYTTQTSGGGANAKSYAIGTASTTFANLDSNYNDFVSTGANAGGFRTGGLGTTATDLATLAAWQAAISDDANSLAADPLYVDPLADLHLQAGSPALNAATVIAAVTNDFDGQTRDATPDIGADERIVFPGTLALSATTYSVGEGGGTATLTVNRTGGSDGTVGASFTLANGSATGGAACGGTVDYVNTGGTVSLANGETTKTFTVAVCDDNLFEGSETFDATLSSPTGGATIGSPATATVTITDNDAQPSVQFASSAFYGHEAAGSMTVTVTRTGATGNAVSVNYGTYGLIAYGGTSCSSGVDYINVGGVLNFASGDTSKTFNVAICPDAVYEGNEAFGISLSGATGGTISGTNPANGIVVSRNGNNADKDGDGKADLGIVRTFPGNTSIWQFLKSSGGQLGYAHGLENDIPTPADFDGDQITDVAVWRPAPAAFYILNSSNATVTIVPMGQTGDNPVVVADYDGDGKADPALYRGGAPGAYLIRRSFANPGGTISTVQWGTTGDRPSVGDFDGNGKADYAIFRPSTGTWWIQRDNNTFYQVTFGNPTDKLVPADYDGDGKTDIAVFRPSDTFWYILPSGGGAPSQEPFGIPTDYPVPADYDGDGKADIAVFRGGQWWIRSSLNGGFTIENFGNATDYPVAHSTVTP